VCLNCAALSETLLESELFGHEKGAFTGATERKIGKFESADRGTLMLDEIGEMSPSIQAKFLRVLEGHPFERVGGNQAIRVDVRVIAATNRDLEKDVAEGKFRRDLYFRLHVVEILVPPLRKRNEDVAELAAHFLERFTGETGKKIRGFTPAAIEHLQKYRWPGNVRELKNVLERLVLLESDTVVRLEHLPLEIRGMKRQRPTREDQDLPTMENIPTLAAVEQEHIDRVLHLTGGNKSQAARLLGISRQGLFERLKRFGDSAAARGIEKSVK
jgi:Nif-specific regulatory protein